MISNWSKNETWEYISLKPEHVAGKPQMDLAVSKM